MTVTLSFTNPVAGSVLARDKANTFTWTRTVTNQGSPTGGGCILRLRPYGTSTWTWSQAGVIGTSYTVPANAMTSSGTWEAQIVYTQDIPYDQGSATVVFTALLASPTPTISAPVSPITNPTATVTWATSPTTQYSVQVQVMDSNLVKWDSGEVVQTAQTMANVPFPDTGVTRQVRVRIRRDDPTVAGHAYTWSDWGTTGNLTVTHLAPPTATITALAAIDFGSIGCTHQLSATFSTPAPSGGAPSVATTEVWMRRSGDTTDGVLVATLTPNATSYRYPAPTHGVTYQMRIKNVSLDGRYSYSSWFTATSAAALKGVVLSHVGAPDVVSMFRLNGEGATDDYAPESALIQYDGREFPVVEFGTAASRVTEVPDLTLRLDSEAAALRTLLLARKIVLYRDRRARKVYGLLAADKMKDEFYGYTTGLTVTAADYSPDRLT